MKTTISINKKSGSERIWNMYLRKSWTPATRQKASCTKYAGIRIHQKKIRGSQKTIYHAFLWTENGTNGPNQAFSVRVGPFQRIKRWKYKKRKLYWLALLISPIWGTVSVNSTSRGSRISRRRAIDSFLLLPIPSRRSTIRLNMDPMRRRQNAVKPFSTSVVTRV